MIREFNRYFKKEECEEVFGEKNGRYFVSWTSIGYVTNDNDEIDDDKWDEVHNFVLDELLSGMDFSDLILESGEDMEWIARNKLVGFTVMAYIDVNDDHYNEALLALTFDTDCGLEDRCHIAIQDDYADAIIAKVKKLIAKKN